MKLRSVLLVLLILCGFYLLSTRLFPIGTIAGLMRGGGQNTPGVTMTSLNGPLGSFRLSEAEAAPTLDAEEQENVGVYKRALPSVVNITSTQVAYDFFYQPVPEQGQGSGFILDKQGHILTNNHVVEGAQSVQVTLSNQKQYNATVLATDKTHDLALLQINNAPDLQPAVLAESKNLMVGQQ